MVWLPRLRKKAPLGAFFVCVLVSCVAGQLYAGCNPDSVHAHLEAVSVERVLDGDTVVLKDGRRIRLVGVNTPEIAHPPKPEEPLGRWATAELASRVQDVPLWLQRGQSPTDHYGRTLGHLFTANGRNITEELLYSGAGFQVAIPPNLGYSDCYAAAQAKARAAGKGVWGDPYFAPVAADSPKLKGGYARVVGHVERVSLTKNIVWVDLQGQISLKLARKNAEFLAGDAFDRVVAASRKGGGIQDLALEARGWVVDRKAWGGSMAQLIEAGKRKPFQMDVQHVSSWELLPTDDLLN